MRSIAIFLKDANKSAVSAFLSEIYPRQKGPPWIADADGDACLYIDFYEDGPRERGIEAWNALQAALGYTPAVSIAANISGRHSGAEQIRFLVSAVLGNFDGCAQDEYSDHCWTPDEVLSGQLVENHSFFDYLGRSAKKEDCKTASR